MVLFYEVLYKSIGQYKTTNTRNNPGKTTRESLSISRHIIFSIPVSVSVHATDNIDCLRFIGLVGCIFVVPPFPCSVGCEENN